MPRVARCGGKYKVTTAGIRAHRTRRPAQRLHRRRVVIIILVVLVVVVVVVLVGAPAVRSLLLLGREGCLGVVVRRTPLAPYDTRRWRR
jgi:hypothetical protein